MRSTRFLCFLSASFLLSGCYTGLRLQEVGDLPALTRTQDPTAYPDYQPVQMPMPPVTNPTYQPNSLWRTGARTFFKDQRASKIGDIVTIIIDINEKAELKNDTKASRDSKTAFNTPNLFGLENSLGKKANPAALFNTNSKPELTTKTKIDRTDKVRFRLAAIVTQVLPSGKLVIMGRQELRVTFEVRDVFLSGVIQPEDINAANEITLDKVAEARLSYGGRGQMMDYQQVPYGQQITNQLLPF